MPSSARRFAVIPMVAHSPHLSGFSSTTSAVIEDARDESSHCTFSGTLSVCSMHLKGFDVSTSPLSIKLLTTDAAVHPAVCSHNCLHSPKSLTGNPLGLLLFDGALPSRVTLPATPEPKMYPLKVVVSCTSRDSALLLRRVALSLGASSELGKLLCDSAYSCRMDPVDGSTLTIFVVYTPACAAYPTKYVLSVNIDVGLDTLQMQVYSLKPQSREELVRALNQNLLEEGSATVSEMQPRG